jgi:type VI secretion system protein ImpH
MATTVRTQDPPLGSSPVAVLLERQPWLFEFYQAVRLCKRFLPKKGPVGGFRNPEEEVLRFAANPSTAFPASQLHKLSSGPDGVALVTVNFFGVFGPRGVLPLWYTDLIMRRVRAGDRALRDFLNIFNHRAISFLYRAWEKYRVAAAAERADTDVVGRHLLHLIGLGTAGLRRRQSVRDEALVFYSGLLSLQPRSATALRHMLSSYFRAPVEIDQFVGAWYRIGSSDRCRLGARESASERLGLGALVGDEVFDRTSRILIRVGPLSLARYREFLPGRPSRLKLRELARFFTGDAFDVDLQLVLRRDQVPRCEIGAEGDGPQLGWSTWIKSAPFHRDPGEAVMRLA